MPKLKKSDLSPEDAAKMSAAELGQYLDIRARKFAEEYLADRNATQAAIRAGYKPGRNNASAAVQGARLVRDPIVTAYRRSLIADELDRKDITKNGLLLTLTEIQARCMQKVPVMENGEETGEWQFDSRGAIKATSEIAKLLGLYAPEKQSMDFSGGGIEALVAILTGKERGF